MRVTALALATVLIASLAACSSDQAPRAADKTSATPTPSRSERPVVVRPAPTVTPSGVARLAGDWKVTALVGDGGSSVLTGRYRHKVRMKFSAGEMTGTTGCNSIFGSYTRSGASGRDLTFSYDYGSTSAYCLDGVDGDLQDLLREVRHVGEADGVVYLMAENGATIAALEPSAPHKPYWP